MTQNKIICITETENERIRYIISFLLQRTRRPVEWKKIAEHKHEQQNIVFSYLKNPHSGIPNIFFSGAILNNTLNIDEYIPLHLVDPTAFHQEYDVISCAFHILARTEEYYGATFDHFGRYQPEHSVLFHHKEIEIPYIDELAQKLIQWIEHNSGFRLQQQMPKKPEHLITFDIDVAWKYEGRGLLRQVMAFGKDVCTLRYKNIVQRLATLLQMQNDPYDVYCLIEELSAKYTFRPVFFIQLRYGSKYDKQVPISGKFEKLLKYLSSFAKIGIHPSFRGGQSAEGIIAEKKLLEQIIEQPVTDSRHHFLRIRIPTTYRHLIEAGITDDYTMGYASITGWRAGTCRPFQWFDAEKNSVTSLTVHPITFMDGTLKDYLKLNTSEALQSIIHLHNVVRQYDGEFVALWHNESISETGRWKGWRNKVFLPMLNTISKYVAATTTPSDTER